MDFNAQVRPGELDCETQGTCSSCEIAIELTRKENVIRKMKRDRDQARDELEVANQRIVNLGAFEFDNIQTKNFYAGKLRIIILTSKRPKLTNPKSQPKNL